MSKDFIGINHGTGQIDLTKHCGQDREFWQYKPIEIHLKENGSLSNKESFCIVMINETKTVIFGQISLEMLNQGLSDIGYKLTKI